MTPGLYPHLSDTDYHAAPGVSNSGLTVLLERTPAHFRAYLSEPRQPTPAMVDGTRLHFAILQPNEFAKRYAVAEKWDLRTNAGKDAKAKWLAENDGKEAIAAPDYDRFMRIRDAVWAHPEASYLMSHGAPEQSVFANDPITGVLCKCRPDFDHQHGRRILVDAKSTENADPREFKWSAYRYGYHRQAAFYMDVCDWLGNARRPDEFMFVAFEKQAPFGVCVMRADKDFIDRGRDEYRQALNLYAECLAADAWPCYSTEIQTLVLPPASKLRDLDSDDIEAIQYVD